MSETAQEITSEERLADIRDRLARTHLGAEVDGTDVEFLLALLEQASNPPMLNDEQFQHHISVVMRSIFDGEEFDKAKVARLLAEIHAYLAFFDRGFRQMFDQMSAMGGPMSMVKAMLKGGR